MTIADEYLEFGGGLCEACGEPYDDEGFSRKCGGCQAIEDTDANRAECEDGPGDA